MITKVTNHEAVAKGRLAEQYKGLPNMEALVGIPAASLQEVENTAWDVLTKRGIDSGEGIHLDNIGVVVGEARFSESDVDYRIRLKARIRANKSTGTIESVISVLKLLTDLGIIVQDLGNASAIISFDEQLALEDDGNPSSRFLQDVVPICVKSHLVFNHNKGAPEFRTGLTATLSGSVSFGQTSLPVARSVSKFPASGTLMLSQGTTDEEVVPYSFLGEKSFGGLNIGSSSGHDDNAAVTLIKTHTSGNSFGFGTTTSGTPLVGRGTTGGGELATVVVSGTGSAFEVPLFGIFPQSLDEITAVGFPNLGAPDSIFKFDVASGNVIDKIGSVELVPQGDITYRVSSSELPGYLATSLQEGQPLAQSYVSDTDTLADSSQSFAILLVARTTTFSGSSTRQIVNRGTTGDAGWWRYRRDSTGLDSMFIKTASDITQFDSQTHATQPELFTVLFGLDLAASANGTLKVYSEEGSDTQALSFAPAAPANTEFLTIANTIGTDGMNLPELFYMCVWQGAAAEGFTAADLTEWRNAANL